MLRGHRRVVTTFVAAAVLVLVAVAAYFLLPPRQTDQVAVPANDATPEQVVTAYLDALNVHDCGTAAAVMTREARQSAETWCHQVASLSNVDVHDHVTEPPEDSGHSAPEEVADVLVTFDLRWRLFHDDGSMPQGATSWGYLLVRDSRTSPWRIFDQGVG
jgi:hypothetical protein